MKTTVRFNGMDIEIELIEKLMTWEQWCAYKHALFTGFGLDHSDENKLKIMDLIKLPKPETTP